MFNILFCLFPSCGADTQILVRILHSVAVFVNAKPAVRNEPFHWVLFSGVNCCWYFRCPVEKSVEIFFTRIG